MAASSCRTAAGKSADIEVLKVPDLDKLLAGERQEQSVKGEFCTSDIMEDTDLSESAARRKLRQAIRRGLVEFVGKHRCQGIDGGWHQVPHYRLVESK